MLRADDDDDDDDVEKFEEEPFKAEAEFDEVDDEEVDEEEGRGTMCLANALSPLSVRFLHAGSAKSFNRSQCLKNRSKALSVTLKLKGR